VVGLALTLLAIWFAWRAKAAAEQVRDQISRFDTIAELSAAITVIEEIRRLQRTQAWEIVWDIVLDRHAIFAGASGALHRSHACRQGYLEGHGR
jgi:uncharacterized alpha-E superfamily protein